MKVSIDCTGNADCGYATIELPENWNKKPSVGGNYLWFGAQDKFLGVVRKRADLIKLRRMIDVCLIEKPKRKPRRHE